MKLIETLCVLLFALLLGACQQQWVDNTGNTPWTASTNPLPEATYDVPPQVIYRIGDHRFISLENYNYCYGDAWYNDTRQGVRTKIGKMAPNNFLGRLVIDDPSGMNVAIPTATTHLCGDRRCLNYAAYSSDAGRTFAWPTSRSIRARVQGSIYSRLPRIHSTSQGLTATSDGH